MWHPWSCTFDDIITEDVLVNIGSTHNVHMFFQQQQQQYLLERKILIFCVCGFSKFWLSVIPIILNEECQIFGQFRHIQKNLLNERLDLVL